MARGLSGKSAGGPGRFVYWQRPQVRPIASPTGRGSRFQANGGCGKWRGPRDVLAACQRLLIPGVGTEVSWMFIFLEINMRSDLLFLHDRVLHQIYKSLGCWI